jgi:Mrp family chromosome partitioning ATPase
VGKSTVATQLSISLAHKGYKVGLLDVDLCGPSVPHMIGIQEKDIYQSTSGWIPVSPNALPSLSVMSIGFLLNSKDDAVVWRGPRKNAMIKQFLTDVVWGELDYLIIDTPPGTSDEHISIVENIQSLKPDGAILVTTPQGVATDDVRREIGFCKEIRLPIIGIIENMCGFVCPHCSECTNIFSSGGGKGLSELYNITFLGSLPIDPKLAQCSENGLSYLTEYQDTLTSSMIISIIDIIINKIS